MADEKLARPSWRGRTNVDALTIACIEHAEEIGGHQFTVTQGSYQSGGGDVNSAGTHDRGGVVDLRWCGHSRCIKALRQAGMAAWHRTRAQGPWVDHIHAVVIGHPLLAASAARQVTAYLNGRNGLANNGADDGPRLNPIPRPVWPWPKEDTMNPAQERKLDQALAAAQKAVAWAESARKQAHAAHVRTLENREILKQLAAKGNVALDDDALERLSTALASGVSDEIADTLAQRLKE